MIYIKPTARKHDSGFNIIEVTDNRGLESTRADIVQITDEEQNTLLKIDCSNGVIRVFSDMYKLELQPDCYSSCCVIAKKK